MENATLVTADWRMHKIAKELGIDVVYTMGTE
jgi:rRNA maturation endonuclease Nob1